MAKNKIILEDNLGNEVLPVTDTDSVFLMDYNTKLTDKIKSVDASLEQKANKDTVAALNAQVSNIVAHNGDGTKDSEVVQARGYEITLADRLNIIDNFGANVKENDYVDGGENFEAPNYPFAGYGVSLKFDDVQTIYSFSILKAKVQSVTKDITVRLFSNINNAVDDSKVLIQEFIIPRGTWNLLVGGQSYNLKLTSPLTIDKNKYYIVTAHTNQCNAQLCGIHYNNEPHTTTKYYQRSFYCNDSTNTIYGVSNYGLYAKFFTSSTITKTLILEGKQIPEHEEKIVDLQNQINKVKVNDKIDINHFTSPLLKVATFTKNWLKQNKDMYIDLYGDSITAWQTSFEKNPLGVSASPPVCDRMGLAGITESIIRYGSPVYRRFDYGKNSLVGQWDNTWVDGDNPYFIESGKFITCYSSSLDNHDSREYDNMLTLPQITTKITQRICPIPSFHRYDYERHIPKRVCSDSNASIQFTIPSGYKKFDFLYHTNQLGDDNVTIAIVEGSGKVKLNNDKRSLGCTTEANGFILNTKETHLESEDGYDSGVLCRRLYFEKTNITDSITVKITKSTDTTKYLMYWGVTYWGTTDEPNACHLLVTGRGSYNSLEMYKKRFHDIGIWDIDLIIHERTIINSFNAWGNGTTPNFDYDNEKFKLLYDYIVSLNIPMITLLPHTFTTALNKPKIYRKYWNQSKAQHIELGLETIDIEKSMYVCWDKNYKSKLTYLDFVKSLMYDGYAHPNEEGFKFYQRFLEHTFNMI